MPRCNVKRVLASGVEELIEVKNTTKFKLTQAHGRGALQVELHNLNNEFNMSYDMSFYKQTKGETKKNY